MRVCQCMLVAKLSETRSPGRDSDESRRTKLQRLLSFISNRHRAVRGSGAGPGGADAAGGQGRHENRAGGNGGSDCGHGASRLTVARGLGPIPGDGPSRPGTLSWRLLATGSGQKHTEPTVCLAHRLGGPWLRLARVKDSEPTVDLGRGTRGRPGLRALGRLPAHVLE